MVKLTLRIEFDEERAIGPGKARLLELIQQHRSISAAGRAMGMSYRRAWLLVDDLNRCFVEPVVQAQHGGRDGGGAALTDFGKALVGHFRAIEAEAEKATRKRLGALRRKLRGIAPAAKP
jgi:molybdate transport system regulatory protein